MSLKCAGTPVLLLLLSLRVGFREASPMATPMASPYSHGPEPDLTRRHSLFPTRLLLEIPYLRECQDVPNSAIKYFKIVTGITGKVDFFLNGMFNISRPAKTISEIILTLTKCKEHVTTNTCEHFSTWRFNKNVCQTMFHGNKIWSKFNENVFPKPTCPPKPGQYHIKNASFDMNVIQALPMPLEGHIYQARHMMMEPNGVPHICSEMQMQFHRARN